MHAQDTANAVIQIIKSKVKNEIYNICGGFEQTNLDTVSKIITLHKQDKDIKKYLDFSYSRQGQDVRYALNDNKLRSLGWKPQMKFDKELPSIVEYYNKNFIW